MAIKTSNNTNDSEPYTIFNTLNNSLFINKFSKLNNNIIVCYTVNQ